MVPDPKPTRAKPVLVYLVTEDWYFMSHRLPMALEAQRAGYDVHVITQVDSDGGAIEALGFRLHPIAWRRGSISPLAFLASLMAVRRLYRAIAPDLVHHVGVQPSIVGSLAATGLPCVRLNAMAGLGFTFTSASLKARVVRPVLGALLRHLLRHPRAAVLVQNPDDYGAVSQLGVAADRLFVIGGSGVDTDRLVPIPEPGGPMTVAFVGRLLDDKGVRALVQAHEILLERNAGVRLLIAGEPDPANPVSIPPAELAQWSSHPNLGLLGHVADIREVWKVAHIAVLPSRREGLPKSLLEAAACGRPIVASDVPGCREIARHDINALLVPPDDAIALAGAIERLCGDAALRRRFGEAGRQIVQREFSAPHVGRQTVALYDRLIGRKPPGHGRS
jgi:glycosyltransferase involved in cell wall biosynthesis